jgi:hypothetical protein
VSEDLPDRRVRQPQWTEGVIVFPSWVKTTRCNRTSATMLEKTRHGAVKKTVTVKPPSA